MIHRRLWLFGALSCAVATIFVLLAPVIVDGHVKAFTHDTLLRFTCL